MAKYICSGDRAITVEFGDTISEDISKKVSAMKLEIEKRRISGVIEVVQSYRSLLVYYNPFEKGYRQLVAELEGAETNLKFENMKPRRTIEIPVLYGGVFGPDLEGIASMRNLSTEEVIDKHTRRDYLVYMIGFTPGFPYLGGIDETISAPRKEKPRRSVPKGSVGIAGVQTGIYPVESPGGWNIIGRTPLELYSPKRQKPVLLEPGDCVKFKIIDETEYRRLKEKVKRGVSIWET